MLMAVVVVVELAARAGGEIATRGRFSIGRLQAQRDALVETAGRQTSSPRWARTELLHPYVGFVPLPEKSRDPFGLLRSTPPAASARRDDQVVVAVVGGSFADSFANEGLPTVMARLADLPAFRGKTFVAVNATGAGYKEPQQLMSVLYLLSVGEQIDIVINLDGFNDVALHPTENAQAGVSPAYPRRWHQRVEGIAPSGATRLMLQRIGIEQHRAALAGTFSRMPLRTLNTANLLYLALDRRAERQLADTDRELLDEERRSVPLASTGPRLEFASDDEMFAYLVALWQRSSRTLQAATTGLGIRYFHFLQPNQYVAGSKPMSPRERQETVRSGHPYQRIVTRAYPLLREAGHALAAEGVRFTDLTDVFVGHPEPLYIDACCHVNARGNAIVAERVFETLQRDLTTPSPASPGAERAGPSRSTPHPAGR